jgi:general stress protein YciG
VARHESATYQRDRRPSRPRPAQRLPATAPQRALRGGSACARATAPPLNTAVSAERSASLHGRQSTPAPHYCLVPHWYPGPETDRPAHKPKPADLQGFPEGERGDSNPRPPGPQPRPRRHVRRESRCSVLLGALRFREIRSVTCHLACHETRCLDQSQRQRGRHQRGRTDRDRHRDHSTEGGRASVGLTGPPGTTSRDTPRIAYPSSPTALRASVRSR